jgi:hypothetical protein
MVTGVRSSFRWLTSVLFVALVVQVGLAGYGAFNAIHKADKVPVSKKTIEDGFNAHGALGTIILVVMLALLIVAAAGHLGTTNIRLAAAIFALGVLQLILGIASTSAPVLGFLHTVNALAIYAASAMIAHRAWTADRVPPAAAAADAAPTA